MFSVTTIRPKLHCSVALRGIAFVAATSIAALAMSVSFTPQALAAADLPLCDTSVNVPGVTDQGVDAIVYDDDGVTEKCLFLASNQTTAGTSTAGSSSVVPSLSGGAIGGGSGVTLGGNSSGGSFASTAGTSGGGGGSGGSSGNSGSQGTSGASSSSGSDGAGSGGGGSQSASNGGGSGSTPADNTGGGGGQTQTPSQNGTTTGASTTPADPNQGARTQLIQGASQDLAQIDKNKTQIAGLVQRLNELSPNAGSLRKDLANQIAALQVQDAKLQASANTKVAEANKLTPAEQTQLQSLTGPQKATLAKLSPQAQKSALAQGVATHARNACAAGQQASCTPQIKAQIARINQSKQDNLSRLTQATAGKGLTPQQRLALVRARQTAAAGSLSPLQRRLAALRAKQPQTKTTSQLTMQQRLATLRARQGQTSTAQTQQFALQRRLAFNAARQRQTQLAATNRTVQFQRQAQQQHVAQFRRTQATRTAQVNARTAFRRQAFVRPTVRRNVVSFQRRRAVGRVVQRRRG